MPESKEDRRQKDLRDFEFYGQRVRPSASELWRTIEGRGNGSARARAEAGGRNSHSLNLRTPASIAEVQAELYARSGAADSSGTQRQTTDLTEADAVWPLATALIVLGFLAWTDSLERVLSAFPF